MAAPTSLAAFEAVFPVVVEALVETLSPYNIPSPELEWFRNCNRGLSVVDTTRLLYGRELFESEFFEASTLGWLVEILQASLLIADDVMDEGVTRRGKPCWYRRQGVGMIALNDSLLLQSSIFSLLKKFFRQHSNYVAMIELFSDTVTRTGFGQLADLLTSSSPSPSPFTVSDSVSAPASASNGTSVEEDRGEDAEKLAKFTPEKYAYIARQKTAYYSFVLPVSLALLFAEKATEKNLAQAEEILVPLGEYFQIQDDFLDVYGKAEEIGKEGTDIIDNKCSWLIVKALQLATADQRAAFARDYGVKDDGKAERVKKMFDDLNLPSHFQKLEEERGTEILKLIDTLDESEGLRKEVFLSFFHKIFKRRK